MDQAKVIKMAPTALMIAFLGYLGYSVNSGSDDPAAPPSTAGADSSKGSTLDKIESEIVALESSIVKTVSTVRDPFRMPTPVIEMSKTETAENPSDRPDQADRIAELLKHMSLDLTFLQGNEQVAIINGKMYRRGQSLTLPESDAEALAPIMVAVVRKNRVYFRAAKKTYALGFPEHLGGTRHPKPGEDEAGLQAEMAEIDPGGQLEFYQSLLNSPLGKLGKGLTGSMGIKIPPSNP